MTTVFLSLQTSVDSIHKPERTHGNQSRDVRSGFYVSRFVLHSACTSLAFAEDRLRLGIKNKKLRFSFCSSLGLHYLCKLNQTILKMTAGNLIRFVCILLLWLFLCYILITRAARIDFMVIFTIVASGIIVFVPLYKKYVRKKN